jgi:hypothetical protein
LRALFISHILHFGIIKEQTAGRLVVAEKFFYLIKSEIYYFTNKSLNMDDVDDHAVARFVEITSATPAHATFFLQACGGNFDRAVQMYQQGLLFLLFLMLFFT